MFDRSQLMRGTLEGCILKIISIEATYGYGIVETLKRYGIEEVSEGTIYPLLLRLEKKQLISSEFRPSPSGPDRKYYFITLEGLSMLQSFVEYWRGISQAVDKILSLEY